MPVRRLFYPLLVLRFHKKRQMPHHSLNHVISPTLQLGGVRVKNYKALNKLWEKNGVWRLLASLREAPASASNFTT